MTWLLLRVLWIASTWAIYPIQGAVDPVVDVLEQHQQMVDDEMLRNYTAEQKDIIIEDYFLFANKIGKIKYARGCIGSYWDNGCSSNAFDCAWLIKAYWIAKGILTVAESKYHNSQTLALLWNKKDPYVAQRWDFTARRGYGDRSTWDLSTHFAIISRDYTGGSTLWIYDNVNGPNRNIMDERAIKVAVIRGKFHYLGKYRISVYTNGLVQTALDRDISVEQWVDLDPVDEVESSEIDPENPMDFSVTIKWYDYDSMANRIASYRYDYNQDTKMIAKFMAEAHFNHLAVGKAWEKWLCQLMNNKTNRVRLNDPRREEPMRQAQICVEKWEAVPEHNRDRIRYANYRTEINNVVLH